MLYASAHAQGAQCRSTGQWVAAKMQMSRMGSAEACLALGGLAGEAHIAAGGASTVKRPGKLAAGLPTLNQTEQAGDIQAHLHKALHHAALDEVRFALGNAPVDFGHQLACAYLHAVGASAADARLQAFHTHMLYHSMAQVISSRPVEWHTGQSSLCKIIEMECIVVRQ